MVVTIHRYVSVKFPLKAKLWFTRKTTKIVIVIIILLVLIINICHIPFAYIFETPAGVKVCLYAVAEGAAGVVLSIYVWFQVIFYVYGPLVVLTIFNVLIIREVKLAMGNNGTNNEHENERNDTVSNKDKRSSTVSQITRMCVIVSLAFVLLNLPNATMIIANNGTRSATFAKTSSDRLVVLVWRIFTHLAYTNHGINFFLYCLSGEKFRNEVKKIFHFIKSPITEGG